MSELAKHMNWFLQTNHEQVFGNMRPLDYMLYILPVFSNSRVSHTLSSICILRILRTGGGERTDRTIL